MKTFKTVKGAAKYINSHKDTGREKTLNDSICFGVGLYCYNEEAAAVGLPVKKNTCFYHISNDEELEKILSYLLRTDGYKSVDRLSDTNIWDTYRRQVGYVAREIVKMN